MPDVSHPYDPLPDAPKDWTLKDALAATKSADGHFHCGQLEFESEKDYKSFTAAQIDLGGSKEQLDTLHYIETTGKPPRMEAMNPPPAGTTVDQLLDLGNQKPDKAGMYHLGSLQVSEKDYAKFAEVQKLACQNPEGLAALYHLEHSADTPPPTFRVTPDNERHDNYDPAKNRINFNPNSAVRDNSNGALLPPVVAVIHEEAHWGSRGAVLDTMSGIPAKPYGEMADRAVIEGAEGREMQRRGLTPRHAHEAQMIPVKGLESTTPSLTMQQDGKEREITPPFQQSGRVIGVKDGIATIAVRGDGTQPEHRMSFKVDQLATAMGQNVEQAEGLLKGAMSHKDTVTFQTTNDGRVVYQNPDQQQRIHDHPVGNIPFPDPMTPPPSAAQQVQAKTPAVEVGGR